MKWFKFKPIVHSASDKEDFNAVFSWMEDEFLYVGGEMRHLKLIKQAALDWVKPFNVGIKFIGTEG